MGLAQRFGIFAVVLLLVATIGAGNAVVASHRTVLDPGFVKSSLDDENAYDTAIEVAATEGPLAATDSTDESQPAVIRNATERIATPEYLKNQTEPNVNRVYAYFHGSSDNLTVVIQTEPLVDRTDDAVEATVANATVRELVTAFGVPLPSVGPVNQSLLLGLTDGPESYRDSREQLRSSVRDRLVTSLVNQSFQQSSNDELLSLVIDDYDPDEYTDEEKTQLVNDRESEIRTAIRDRIERERGDEIDQEVATQLNDTRTTLKDDLAAPETGLGEDVDAAASNLTVVFVDGLLAPNYTYDSFRTDLDTRKAELGGALGDAVQSRLDEQLDDEIRPFSDANLEDQQAVQRARQAVQILDGLGVALPAFAVLLLVVLRLLANTWATTALWSGVATAVGGAPLFVATLFQDRLAETIRTGSESAAAADLAVALVAGLLDVVATQSLILIVVGTLVASVGMLVRTGVISKN